MNSVVFFLQMHAVNNFFGSENERLTKADTDTKQHLIEWQYANGVVANSTESESLDYN